MYIYKSLLLITVCVYIILYYYYLSADLFQSSSVLAYSCNPPTPSCRLQSHHPADCMLLCCRLQDPAYSVQVAS